MPYVSAEDHHPRGVPNLDDSITLENDGTNMSYVDPVCIPAVPTAELASGSWPWLGAAPVAHHWPCHPCKPTSANC